MRVDSRECRTVGVSFSAIPAESAFRDFAVYVGFIRYPSARSGGVGAGMKSVGSLWREIVSMAGYLVRAGGGMLAALAIVAGGAASAGTAGAQSLEPGTELTLGPLGWSILFGLVDAGSVTEELGACEPPYDVDRDAVMCDDLRFDDWASVENFQAKVTGRDQMLRGEEAVVRANFSMTRLGEMADPQSGLELASATVRTPRGFEFKGGKASLSGVSTTTPLDLTYTVDPETGDVTVTAATGSMDLTAWQTAWGWSSDTIHMELTYVATEYVTDGETALRFSGTGVPDSGWVASGVTQVTPDLGPFGSSGSATS